MDRVFESGAAGSPPSAPASPSSGYPTAGNPQTAVPATKPGPWWYHMMTEELRAVIVAAGLTPDHTDVTQLTQAIQALFVANQKAVVINGATFEASVADGELVRWDSGNSRFDEAVADGTSNNRAVGVADVTNSKVYLYGECPLFSGLTPGARYYLNATTPGAITATAPTDAVMVGIAKSATVLWVDVDPISAQTNQHGQCRLVKSGANLVLKPFNGNKIIINGAVQTIPAAGVSLAATGLTVGANYYVYAYMAGSTMTLEPSVTEHVTDATTGVEVKSGDATRTLVGFARVITGPAWQDSNAQRFVRSWFNEASISGRNAASSDKTTTSTSWVAISTTELRIEFLSWAGENVIAAFSGEVSINLDNQFVYTALYLDGAPTSGGGYAKHSRGNLQVQSGMGHHVSTHDDIAEGYHYVDVYGSVSIGTVTGTWIGGTSPKLSNINFRVAK